MGKGSQKLDIEDIRDALIGGIGSDGSTLAELLAGEIATALEVDAIESRNQVLASLREILFHLRIITGEHPTEDEL